VPVKPRVYTDSCCFIELALQSIGKHKSERENDLWHLKALFDAAFDEKIELLTATLSIAECSHANGDVSDDIKSLFKRLLTSGRYILLVQDTVLVAERARNLRWAHGLTFRGADAIHIASAMEMKCDEFLTWDNRIHGQAEALANLGLPIHYPCDTGSLPMEYRQQNLLIPAAADAEAATDQEGQQLTDTEVPTNESGKEATSDTKAGDEHETDPTHPAPVRGSDEGRVESEAPGEAPRSAPEEPPAKVELASEKPKAASEGGLGESGS